MSRRRPTRIAFSLFSFQDIITSVTGIMILITLILALELVTRIQSAPAYQTTQQQETTQETIEHLRRELEAREQWAGSDGEADLKGLPTLDALELRRLAELIENNASDLEQQIANAQSQAAAKSHEADIAKSEAAAEEVAAVEQLKKVKEAIAEAEVKLAQVQSRERVYFKPGDPNVTTWLIETQEQNLTVAQLGISAPPQVFSLIHELDSWAKGLDPDKNDFLLLVKPGGENRAKKCETLLRDRGHGFHVGLQVVPEGRIVIDPTTGAGA